MATQGEHQIVLYDLACTKNQCFSPVVWRIRLMLNYKRIPYTTIFLEFPDIEPTLKDLGIPPGPGDKYTVPAIHHLPTNRYLMDSPLIAEFLESTYPDPAVPLTLDLGAKIEIQARSVLGPVVRNSIMPREINILCPRAQEYFRRTREAALGQRLEKLLDEEKEEQSWKKVEDAMRGLGALMRTHQDQGPFILGAKPSYTDFFIAGSLESFRMVEENVFQRIVACPGYRDVYEACLPFMMKRD